MTTPADEPVTDTDEQTHAQVRLPVAIDTEIADAELVDAGDADTEDGVAEAVSETESTDEGFAERDDEFAQRGDAEETTFDDGEFAEDSGEFETEVAGNHPATIDDDERVEQPTGSSSAWIPAARDAAPTYESAQPETDSLDPDFVPTRRGRGGFDPEADAIARAARYTFRQRTVLALVLAAVLCGGLGIAVAAQFWFASGLAVVAFVGYLAYLRKQVRMEEDIRRRRAARLTRGQQHPEYQQPRRVESEAARQAGMDRDTARRLRRRSTLLEVDDEDPMFENLDAFDPAAARALRTRTGTDLRRAAGA
ncbi:hypothetical protein GCM10023318_04990 [Nocardia callitridis]|uniref:DUF3040 domain-containing protein n=2 Tax=Nocardia callitridis TaxID=648753 RepID=A0ABP9JUC8_9NOCA